MFVFTDGERASLREMSALTTDSNGREVLAGLTADETELVMLHRRDFAKGIRHREQRARVLDLVDKHERARLLIIGAEVQLRRDNPPVH